MVEFIIKVKENVYAFYCFSYGIVDENNANDFLSIEVNEIFLSYRERQLFLHLHNNRNVYLFTHLRKIPQVGLVQSDPLRSLKLQILQVANFQDEQEFPLYLDRFPTQVYWSYMFSLSFFRVCVMHMLKEHCIL